MNLMLLHMKPLLPRYRRMVAVGRVTSGIAAKLKAARERIQAPATRGEAREDSDPAAIAASRTGMGIKASYEAGAAPMASGLAADSNVNKKAAPPRGESGEARCPCEAVAPDGGDKAARRGRVAARRACAAITQGGSERGSTS